MASPLPHCDEVFLQFIDPFYDDASRARRGTLATKGDLVREHEPTDADEARLSLLDDELTARVRAQLSRMRDAAIADFEQEVGVRPPIDLHYLDKVDAHYDRARIAKIFDRANADEDDNDLLVAVIEFSMVLAEVLQQSIPSLKWRCDWPYWESSLFDGRSGTTVNVFHWAVKKFSEYGVDDGFAVKVQVCADLLEQDASDIGRR